MSVRIEIENRGRVFTSLDYISGKIYLNLPTEETISAITVKLEGLSQSKATPPPREDQPHKKRWPEVEIHRLLYVVQTVFPSPEFREKATSGSSFTLNAGEYEYPFKIRIPINNACTNGYSSGMLGKLGLDADFAREGDRHVRGTLPPSLSGVADDAAWIRYFLKATVNRPKFYKTNMRTHDPFVFLPIEPPRPPPSDNEAFAKRQFEFPLYNRQTPKKRGLFSGFRQTPAEPKTMPIRVAVQTRLPVPSILVPNDPIPLRILLEKLEPFTHTVYIRSLQIALISHTTYEARGIGQKISNKIMVISVPDTRTPFGNADSPMGAEIDANPSLWRDASLPDTVPPSFVTCNIQRSYELEISIRMSYGNETHIEALPPLTIPVEVYSGIPPPKKLLETANKAAPTLPPRRQTILRQPLPRQPTLKVPDARPGYQSAKSSPTATSPQVLRRPQSSSAVEPIPQTTSEAEEELPPPTYEDAIEEDIGPVDGARRRTYMQDQQYYQALPDNVHT